MSRGKYLSLEEARKGGKLDQFAKEHPIDDVHPQAHHAMGWWGQTSPYSVLPPCGPAPCAKARSSASLSPAFHASITMRPRSVS